MRSDAYVDINIYSSSVPPDNDAEYHRDILREHTGTSTLLHMHTPVQAENHGLLTEGQLNLKNMKDLTR